MSNIIALCFIFLMYVYKKDCCHNTAPEASFVEQKSEINCENK